MMKNILTIICLTLLSFSVSAQSRLKKADDLYNLKSYWSAATKYEQLIDSDNDSPAMRIRLANSYYFMNNYEKALKYYEIVAISEFQKEDLYNYIQTSKIQGDYAKSTELLQHFCKQFGDDRCKEFNQNPNYLNELKNTVHFTLAETQLNTDNNEFGGYQSAGNIYILSDRGTSGFINRKNLYNGKGFLDIYRVQKQGEDSYSKAKKVKGKINSKLNEGSISFTPDGKKVYFTRNNKKPAASGLYQLSIFIADIDAKGKWINIRGLSINSNDYSVGHPVITKDGKKILFSSTMKGGYGGADLYIADLTENGDVSNVKNMGNIINTPRNEFFPWISTDGNIYFTSDGHPGFGGLDNFVAVMAGSDVVKILNCGANINSSQDDFALTLSDDGINGYVSSNRTNGKGGDDIYGVKLIKAFPRMIVLSGKTTDLLTNNSIGNVQLRLKNITTGEFLKTSSDEIGNYSLFVTSDSEFELTAEKDEYIPLVEKFTSANSNLSKNISLEENRGSALVFKVLDKNDKSFINGAKITIKDKTGKMVVGPGQSDINGEFKQLIEGTKKGDQLNYKVKIEKPGYVTKEIPFNHTVALSGEILIPIEIDKMEVGKDLASIISINPIYFDLNSAKVRPDAALELDKIVDVLNDNPTMVIELGSHTDCRGSKKSNETLSDKRAKASADYIKKRITNPTRISGKGYGENKLLNDCACEGKIQPTCTEEEHALNRRTEFRIIKF